MTLIGGYRLIYTQPIVGFDRFIRYEWAERALEIAVQREDPKILHEWLLTQGLGPESARRTWNCLVRLWVRPFPTIENLRVQAFQIFPTLLLKERLALHWGIAIAQFPLFQQTVKTIGLLSRLQNDLDKHEIVRRILENYSNQTTIRRATERILQTLHAWGILEATSPKNACRVCAPITLTNVALIEWLFQAIVHATDKQWPLLDLLRAPEMLPFQCVDANLVLYQSPLFSIQRDSFDIEVVELTQKTGI